jgi:hypothetical protein
MDRSAASTVLSRARSSEHWGKLEAALGKLEKKLAITTRWTEDKTAFKVGGLTPPSS